MKSLVNCDLASSTNGRVGGSKVLGVKFKETSEMILAGLGLATIARNKLKTSNPDVACEPVKVPSGVEIVRSTSVEPAVAAPEVQPEAPPAVTADTVKFVVRIRSMSDKWIRLREPMPGGTIWVYRQHVLAINHLPDSDSCELVVLSEIAEKKGWAA